MPDLHSQPSSLGEVLITEALFRRMPSQTLPGSPQVSDLKAENDALRRLAQQLVEQPQALLDTLATLALTLSQAESAGVSLLETTPVGEEVFRWVALALEAHPHWHNFGKEAENHPPLQGWLAAPLLGRDGQNIGLIQLSDKCEGEFTEADEAILVQLAQMASVAIENARLYEAEQQARSAAEASRGEAEAANRVKDEFLAVLSHELRTPLSPILGWSTMLRSRQYDAATTDRALETIERNAKLQTQLIEDLLDVSRILQGKLRLESVSVNLATIITSAIETVRLAANTKSIQLQTNLNSTVGNVCGDPGRLQQVIWNLLSNAVKFTPHGGRVEVCLEPSPRLPLHPSTPPPLSSYAQIRVTDTGKGIEPEFLPYVFDTFRQADGAITRKFGGLGLGLAIARHIVELHGGIIAAASPGEGQGATFVVRLPLKDESGRDEDGRMKHEGRVDLFSMPHPSALPLAGLKILVVDDQRDARDFFVFVLEQVGADVIAVTSAVEALCALIQVKPDVLLSDIGMPEMDGYQLIQQVRTLPPEQGGAIPAIALTAYAGEIDQQQAMAAGFHRHLPKPIDPEVLVNAIAPLNTSNGRLTKETG